MEFQVLAAAIPIGAGTRIADPVGAARTAGAERRLSGGRRVEKVAQLHNWGELDPMAKGELEAPSQRQR